MTVASLFFSDEFIANIFQSLNLVIIAWALLFIGPFFPRFKYTFITVDCIALVYCVIYLVLILPIIYTTFERGDSIDFGSLEDIHKLFQFKDVMLAGWTHYVAFDLLIACGIVLDAKYIGLPHAYVCLCLPILLMAGPVGVIMYILMRELFLTSRRFRNKKLVVMYMLVVMLCIMMICWIFVFPATGFMTENRTWLWGNYITTGEESVSTAVPLSLTTKYIGYKSVQYFHQFPCGLWVTILPFQLLPSMRKKFPTIHKMLGYMFATSSMILMIGVILIHNYKLGYVQNDYPKLIPLLLSQEGISMANEYGIFGIIARILLPYDRIIMVAISVWFISTIFFAIKATREKKFQQHRAWIYRHAASGLWVAVMRLFVVFGIFADRKQEMGKFINFTCGIVFSCILTSILAEIAIYEESLSNEKFESSVLLNKSSKNQEKEGEISFCTCF